MPDKSNPELRSGDLIGDIKTLSNQMSDEARRIEEDSTYSAKSHLNAASRWARYHLWIGLPSAIAAAIAGFMTSRSAEWAMYLALLSCILTSLLTFLNPSERSKKHSSAGHSFLKLKNDSRIFANITLKQQQGSEELSKSFMELAGRRDELISCSLDFSHKDYEKARQDIIEGRTEYIIDKEKHIDCK